MRNTFLLLAGVVLLYLASSLVLQGIYGESYGFFAGEDRWRPDGNSGWVRHGVPSAPPPSEPSQNIPLLLNYLPIFLPGLLLALFLFTPLSKKLEPKRSVEIAQEKPTDGDA